MWFFSFHIHVGERSEIIKLENERGMNYLWDLLINKHMINSEKSPIHTQIIIPLVIEILSIKHILLVIFKVTSILSLIISFCLHNKP
jgi:hypothetical protein